MGIFSDYLILQILSLLITNTRPTIIVHLILQIISVNGLLIITRTNLIIYLYLNIRRLTNSDYLLEHTLMQILIYAVYQG